ncbi:MAG TPA: DUF2442 domain-containing protein [Rhodothermales bacterium]|nr:DUF2442 domain-containing protein [Rhodothermales bacterium]
MTTLVLEKEPEVVEIETTDNHLVAHLADGRLISIPLEWYPRLENGTTRELANYELSGGGYGVHWPDLDEDISVENMLEGRRSQESEESFQRWLSSRTLTNSA